MRGFMRGFRRMDEMERYIAYVSMSWSYAYMVAFLAAWGAYNQWVGTSPAVPSFLIATQFLVQAGVQFVLKRRAAGQGEESEE